MDAGLYCSPVCNGGKTKNDAEANETLSDGARGYIFAYSHADAQNTCIYTKYMRLIHAHYTCALYMRNYTCTSKPPLGSARRRIGRIINRLKLHTCRLLAHFWRMETWIAN